jgi:hypothetical protein
MRPKPIIPGARLACALVVVLALPGSAAAQGDPRDHNVALAYEGFSVNEDGSYRLWFGYFNRNRDRVFDVPIGPDNRIEPYGPDAGQPTHFFPRRNQFVFSVPAPADFGEDDEVVWTLTTNGVTERAYATRHPLYMVDDVVMMANFGAGGRSGFNPATVGNQAPEMHLESESMMHARVGEPVTLSAVATDDGRPRRARLSYRVGDSHEVPNSATGLRFSWFHYRGPGEVTFDPPQTKVWQDTRDGGASPWSVGWEVPEIPAENRWTTRATFGQPGRYVVRGLAHDGGLMAWEDVTVVVEP